MPKQLRTKIFCAKTTYKNLDMMIKISEVTKSSK